MCFIEDNLFKKKSINVLWPNKMNVNSLLLGRNYREFKDINLSKRES